MRHFCLAGFTCLLGLAFVSSAKANIVSNPGFEAGGTGWSASQWGFNLGFFPHSGTGSADTLCASTLCITSDPDPFGAWLFQDLATAPGTPYNLTFWYNADVVFNPARPPNELRVLFGSTVAVDLIDITAPGYIQYMVTLTATSNTTRLEFLGREVSTALVLDDISVVAAPEPSAYLLLGSGLVLLAGRRRLRA